MKPELMINMKDDYLLEDDITKIQMFLSKLSLDDVIDIYNLASEEINLRNK